MTQYPNRSSSSKLFSSFIQEQIGAFGTIISSIPILADYTVWIPSPGKYAAVAATFICFTIFFGLFWIRDKVYKSFFGFKSFYAGFSLGTIGVIFIIAYDEYRYNQFRSPSPEHFVVTLFYIFGFLSIVTGILIILIYGFVQENERMETIQQTLPIITPSQWDFIEDILYSLCSITQKIDDPNILEKSKIALENSAKYFYQNTREIFQCMEKKSEIIVQGPGIYMDTIYSIFLEDVLKVGGVVGKLTRIKLKL